MDIGQRVCVVGEGTSAVPGYDHWHGTVVKVTKTQIVVKSDARGVESRFNKKTLYSIPRSDWGGFRLAMQCQRPRVDKSQSKGA